MNARQVVITTGIVLGLTLLAAALVSLVVFATDACLLVFLGVLFAIFLCRLCRWLPFPHGISLGIVVVLLLCAAGTGLYLFGTRIEEQAVKAADKMDEGLQSARQFVRTHHTARWLLGKVPFASAVFNEASGKEVIKERSKPSQETDAGAGFGKAVIALGQVSQTTFGILMNFLLTFFIGLFLATEPVMYRDGLVSLFPPAGRLRTREILNELADTLWHWSLGQLCTMTITGVGTGVSLWLLGVPLAGWLGLLTGLLTFIPNVGPALALIASVLVGLTQGAQTAGLVVMVFIGFQLLESYVITPLIQYEQVAIPPALLISTQLFFALFAGFLGLLVATPMLAAMMVLVRRVYQEGILGNLETVSS